MAGEKDNSEVIAALQEQITELNGRVDVLLKRIDVLTSPENVPAARLGQIEYAISHLGAILHESKPEYFKTDVTELLGSINQHLAPLRARLAQAEADAKVGASR